MKQTNKKFSSGSEPVKKYLTLGVIKHKKPRLNDFRQFALSTSQEQKTQRLKCENKTKKGNIELVKQIKKKKRKKEEILTKKQKTKKRIEFQKNQIHVRTKTMMEYIHTRNPVSARFLGKSVRTNHNFFKQVYLPKLSNKTGQGSGKNGCCLKINC